MRTPLEQTILHHVRTTGLFSAGDRVGVAVSGGADSVALLRILESIRSELGVSLSVVHFDHCLRGAESDLDAGFVGELSRAHGFEFTLERADVAAEARRNGWNIEDAARRLRYDFFHRVVEQGRADGIAVAHTADDQAETLIGHLMRGTGPKGLGGIHPVAGVVVRPLLNVRRRELREYLARLGQAWREDSSNNDVSRLRVRIRTKLLPQIERDFSPRIVEHLCELASFAREEEVFWSALVDERYRNLVRSEEGSLIISVEAMLNPLAAPAYAREAKRAAERDETDLWRPLTERIIRRLYENLRGTRRGLTSDHVQQVIHLATESTSGRRVSLLGGISVERTFGDLRFSLQAGANRSERRGQTVQRPVAYQYVVGLPAAGAASVCVPELGVRFRLKLVDWVGTESETKRDSQVLDAQSLRVPLILRNWRPGDAYTPFGRRQPRKLKQMFMAARVPSGARREWPVLESAGRVVWARGLPPAAEFCAGESTRVGVVIEEDRL